MLKRIVILGGGTTGASSPPSSSAGSEVTIAEMPLTLIPQEDEDAAKELLKQFKKRGTAVHLDSQCDRIEDTGSGLKVHFGGESVECDLALVATGRGPVHDLGLEEIGVERTRRRASPPTSTVARPFRTSMRLATAPATGSSRTPRSARARSRPRTPRATRQSGRQPRRAAADLYGSRGSRASA